MTTNNDPTVLLLDHNNPSLNNKYDKNSGNEFADGDKIVIKLRPIGQIALNGLSSSYDPTFPAELEGVVPKHIFERDIERFNHRLTDYWPCPCCFGFGYACCICTLGMSWYFPSMCVASAEKFAVQYFEEQANSRSEYFDIKLRYKLQRRCCSSWVEVSFIPPPSNTTGKRYDNGKSKGDD